MEFSKGESGRVNWSNTDLKNWFPGALHLILNSQGAFIVGLYNITQMKGKGEKFLKTLHLMGCCRKLILCRGRLKVKISEKGNE